MGEGRIEGKDGMEWQDGDEIMNRQRRETKKKHQNIRILRE